MRDPFRFTDVIALVEAPDAEKQRVLRKPPAEMAILPAYGVEVDGHGKLAQQLPAHRVEIEILLEKPEALPQRLP